LCRGFSGRATSLPVGTGEFEAYLPGSVYEFGHEGLSEAEIVAFAAYKARHHHYHLPEERPIVG
jgi:hypothetical protein